MIFESIFNAQKEHERPVIGIVPTELSNEAALHIPIRYLNAIVASGGAPLILPLTKDIKVYETLFPLIDGFVLTGGQDLSPELYHESRDNEKLGDLTPNREELECLVLSYCYKYDVPALGICRGMQMMNVYFGGTLYLDLADQFETDAQNNQIVHNQETDYDRPSHFVKLVRASKLSQILDTDTLATNSMHHQGVRDIAPLMAPAAFGPDGLVEAIEVKDRSFIVGVQWHPEFFAGEKNMGCIFNSLVMQAELARVTGRAGAAPELTDEDKATEWSKAHGTDADR